MCVSHRKPSGNKWAIPPKKCTARCTVSTCGMVGPISLSDTMNVNHYLHPLKKIITPVPPMLVCQFQVDIFSTGQGSNAYNKCSVECSHQAFPWVKPVWLPAYLKYRWFWPTYPLDLNPYEFFLWIFLKPTVYRNNPHITQEVKQEI
jgi:hypothetical protein